MQAAEQTQVWKKRKRIPDVTPLQLYLKHAPQACKNFLELSKKGYYDGTVVSKAAAGFTPRSSRLATLGCPA